MKQRFANVIYLFAIIAGSCFFGLAPLVYLDLKQRFEFPHAAGVTAYVFGIGIACFLLGWAIRYVMIGTKALKPEL